MEINSLESLKNYVESKDNANSEVYFSSIPTICKTEKCILGVDEAGKIFFAEILQENLRLSF